jgi:hypothetical protein
MEAINIISLWLWEKIDCPVLVFIKVFTKVVIFLLVGSRAVS